MTQEQQPAIFRQFILAQPPLHLREPLAATLGVFDSGDVLAYSYADAIRAAGHACPTVTGAWLMTREALARLYRDEIPVRGQIAVKIYGKPDEGGMGVMSQVMGYITGAAAATGFKGLAGSFRRQGLLEFSDERPDARASCVRFTRTGTGRSVLARFMPWNIPFESEKAARLGQLMEKVVTGTADAAERRQFGDLWMDKVAGMIEGRGIDDWLRLEED